jgi:hypothetical protein
MTNFEYYKTLTIGVIIGASTVILAFYMVKPEPQQPDAPKSNFEVVDTYSYENRTCSVIRYTNPSTTWVYFLDCKEVNKDDL